MVDVPMGGNEADPVFSDTSADNDELQKQTTFIHDPLKTTELQSTGEMKFHKTLTLSNNGDDKSFKKAQYKGSTSSMGSNGLPTKSDNSAVIGQKKDESDFDSESYDSEDDSDSEEDDNERKDTVDVMAKKKYHGDDKVR